MYKTPLHYDLVWRASKHEYMRAAHRTNFSRIRLASSHAFLAWGHAKNAIDIAQAAWYATRSKTNPAKAKW